MTETKWISVEERLPEKGVYDYLYNAAFLAGWRAAAQIAIHKMPTVIPAEGGDG